MLNNISTYMQLKSAIKLTEKVGIHFTVLV